MAMCSIPSLFALLLGTPLGAEPFYERTKIELQGHQDASIKTLLAAIEKSKAGQRLYWRTTSTNRVVSLDSQRLAGLPRPGLIALYIALKRDQRGSEADLVIPRSRPKSPPHFATILHEPDDRIVLIYNPRQRHSFQHRHLTGARQPVAVDGDRAWSAKERALLHSALARLTEGERRLISNLSFVRHRVGEQGAHNAALHVSKGCRSHVRVFDTLFEGRPSVFTGDPEAPISMAEYGLLHEIGHAIANAAYKSTSCALDKEERIIERLRREANAATDAYNRRVDQKDPTLRQEDAERLRAHVQSVSQRIASYNQARAQAKADRHMGPVRSRFEQQTAGALPVTRYAGLSLDERFAEAFALARTDPAAVRRIAPKVLTFFQTQQHLKDLRTGR
ncbi:MAG: hypothetical protein CMH55_04735 [Myxococcales bacterium]|nr:hypothetical protein [Myxococcales bacterium]